MNLGRLTRAFTLGVCASLLVPAVADAQRFRLFDPVTSGFVTYDTAPQQQSRQALPAPQFMAQVVDYPTTEAPGTVIIDTAQTYLYYVLGDGTAIRYGIGVGREGFTWAGAHTVTRKAEWPDWTPPQEMLARQPYLPRWMAGGPGNPMGAAALYLGDTVYRIHGTNAPGTIGHAVSSGCFRLVNDDVADLFQRVPVGTKVVVQH